jgi:hypothetical protein
MGTEKIHDGTRLSTIRDRMAYSIQYHPCNETVNVTDI